MAFSCQNVSEVHAAESGGWRSVALIIRLRVSTYLYIRNECEPVCRLFIVSICIFQTDQNTIICISHKKSYSTGLA